MSMHLDKKEGLIRCLGYAAVTGTIDRDSEVLHPGLFKNWIYKQQKSLPVFFQHDYNEAIGYTEIFAEDSYGLKVAFYLFDTSSKIEMLQNCYKANVEIFMSVGFDAVKCFHRGTQLTRVIEEAVLKEVSLTFCPANEKAKLLSLKT